MKKKILYLYKKDCAYSLKLLNLIKKKFNVFFFNDIKFKSFLILNPKLKFDFIVSFRNQYILNKNTLKKAKIAAINFHPSTPKYRGIGCINFALFNNEKYFGCTAHLMDEKIDHGKIISVNLFKIDKNRNLDQIYKKTIRTMFYQAKKIINKIKSNNNYLTTYVKDKKLKWSKKIYSRKDLNNLYNININISKSNLRKILKSTVTKNFKPYIKLHDYKFYINKSKNEF